MNNSEKFQRARKGVSHYEYIRKHMVLLKSIIAPSSVDIYRHIYQTDIYKQKNRNFPKVNIVNIFTIHRKLINQIGMALKNL